MAKIFLVNNNGTIQLANWSTPCDVQIQRVETYIHNHMEPILLPFHIALCVLGLLVSSVNVTVLTRPTMAASSLNLLLAALEIANLVFAVAYIPQTVILHSFPSMLVYKAYAYVRLLLVSITWAIVTFTVWMTAIIGTWRCLAVVWPLQAKLYLTKFRARVIIIILALMCLIFCTVVCFSVVRGLSNGPMLCGAADFDFENCYMYKANDDAWRVGTVVSVVVFLAIPSMWMVFITISLFWSLFSSAKKRLSMTSLHRTNTNETNTTSTVVLIILLLGFLTTNLLPYLSSALLLYNDNYVLPYPWKYLLEEFVFGLIMNIFSFAGYYLMASKFRDICWNFAEKIRCPEAHIKILNPNK